MIAAAERAGYTRTISENLEAGQRITGTPRQPLLKPGR